MSEFFVTLEKIEKNFKLEVLNAPENYQNVRVFNTDVNRPGLPISGYFEYYDPTRLQVMGRLEYTYLTQKSQDEQLKSLSKIFAAGMPALILTRGIEFAPHLLDLASKYKIPVFRTQATTSRFMSALIAFLNTELAPRITRHGVLVEVYGEGVLLLGESGVGKSETAVELVKRGHRLVADDAVEIKRVSDITLVGSAPENIRHFVELRGIGIIDVKKIFGMGAVRDSEKIDLIINLEAWQNGKAYERLGLVEEITTVLDIDIPSHTIPVHPGRNLAIIIEVAAMNNRQRKMGYNAAEVLTQRIMNEMLENENE